MVLLVCFGQRETDWREEEGVLILGLCFLKNTMCVCMVHSQFLQIGSVQVAKIHAVVGTIPGPREHVLDVLMYCYL